MRFDHCSGRIRNHRAGLVSRKNGRHPRFIRRRWADQNCPVGLPTRSVPWWKSVIRLAWYFVRGTKRRGTRQENCEDQESKDELRIFGASHEKSFCRSSYRLERRQVSWIKLVSNWQARPSTESFSARALAWPEPCDARNRWTCDLGTVLPRTQARSEPVCSAV